jgi:ApbE superfamily uncharacterized protein (UPF0280 family)
MYQPRTYRRWVKDDGLVSFNVVVKETDLYIRATKNLEAETRASITKHRAPLEAYIASHPLFLHSLEPVSIDDRAPEIVKDMIQAAATVGVGPMAAVAGAIAERVGRDLLAYSPEVIVENGGDIFAMVLQTRLIGVYAGDSHFTGKIALEISPEKTPLGICTSSGTVGHSLSLGVADAVIIISHSTSLADAAATAVGNKVTAADDIDTVIEELKAIPGLLGAVLIKGDRMGVWGDVKLVPL